ncbi:MAG TPA: c-type cytochrome, partial [Candidatus Tectomicrobia bacterium]|nr:c-type cytochrome [Candidatus Tectomicrobia bacterium]
MRSIRFLICGVLAAATAAALAHADTRPAAPAPAALAERGRYLMKIAGCNDCHTARYAETAGAVPEAEWLTGDSLGWRGPWGTTYPINLRLYIHGMSEEQWLAAARAVRSRPPMPWFALRDMTDEDLRAIYHFVRSLGPAGNPAPAYVPPGAEPRTPY